MTDTDQDLLRQFARDGTQVAFTELVRRHVNLVYSAALRQVRSPQLAEEVAQSVFADLARVAATPSSPLGGCDASSPTSLTPWLYTVTRRTAVDVIRKESRRQLREQIAVEMNAMNATESSAGVPPAWSEIEPLLDEAVSALDETDRAAVLLRYFENKSLREVGAALGVSDDTAQKRVSRAVERLRDFFSKRNVTIGASGLAVVISANAVQAAPPGLAATISAAAILAGTAVSTSTLIAATKTIAMTTLQKTLVTATVAVLAGAGIYEARQAAQLRDQNQTLQQQQAPMAEQIQKLQNNFADATNRLADLLAENSRLKSNPNQTELLKLRGEVGVLRNQASPELQKEKLSAQAQFTRDEDNRLSRATLLMNDLMGNAYGTGKGKLPADFNQFTNIIRDGHGSAFFEQIVMPEFERFDFFNFDTDVFIHDARGATLNPDFKHRLVVCREKSPRQGPDGIWYRIYGVVDLGGNLLEATSNDGNFDAWEKDNVIFTPPLQK
ncbi:MAG TPA: sigma-70 family RNA polymerase sigma factor [Verrucomicrobiae bacterium]